MSGAHLLTVFLALELCSNLPEEASKFRRRERHRQGFQVAHWRENRNSVGCCALLNQRCLRSCCLRMFHRVRLPIRVPSS
uniref:Putative secreted protein n=1 Tax=Ixodes ricinus TaxID=34613 RepID=A0A6B0U604_IXORI